MSIEQLYQEMYEHTRDECKGCRVPHACCSLEMCEFSDAFAQEQGIKIEKVEGPLPFMGVNGCVVPPHLRPLCTVHTCDIMAFGYKPGDQEWTDEYFRLRDLIGEKDDR